MTVVEPTRRERKKLATREALHLAALGLTEERGLAHVTVEAITERADVAPRTFFNYFSSKEEAVLDADPEERLELVVTLRRRLADQLPLDALRDTLVEYLPKRRDPDGSDRRMALVRSEPQLLAAMTTQWWETERMMSTAIADHLGLDAETHPYPSLLVSVCLWASRTTYFHCPDRDDPAALERSLLEAFAALAAGLPVPARPTEEHPS